MYVCMYVCKCICVYMCIYIRPFNEDFAKRRFFKDVF